MLNLEKKVGDTLHGLGLENPEIEVYTSGGSVFATVVSGSFTNMDEAERQRQIWTALRGSLSGEERLAIEFVFTIAPDEKDIPEQAV